MKDNEVEDLKEPVPPHLNPKTNQNYSSKKAVNAYNLLEFVCWIADADKMYEVALCTYDLDIAAMTAQFTQKDPKEYLPYLEELKNIENEIERKAKICLDAKKIEKAAFELSKGDKAQ